MEPTRAIALRVVAPRVALLTAAGVVLIVLGRVRLAAVLLIAAAAWSAIGLLAPRSVARIDGAFAGAGRAVGTILATTISVAAMVVIIIPLGLLSKLVRVSPLDSGWGTGRSAWISYDGRGGGAAGSGARAKRMSASELRAAPRVRWRNRLRNALGLAIVGVLVVLVAVRPFEDPAPPVPTARPIRLLAGFRFSDYAFADEPWAYDLYVELDDMVVLKDLLLGYRLSERYDGRYLNIVDGHRVSRQPEAKPELRVWFFGGSTMFGLGQRDRGTIPSVISELAERDGVPIEVVNYGVPGYTNWSELQQYLELSSSDAPPPDLVVFYDGINDFTLANERVDIGDVDPDHIQVWAQTPEAKAIFRQSVEAPEPVHQSERSSLVSTIGAAQYGRGIRAIRQVSAGSGVASAFYWQPTLQTKKESKVDEPVFAELNAKQSWVPDQRRVYNAIRAQSGEDVIDLSTALDGATAPVLMDWSHTNERGARMISEAMYRTLGPQLHQLAGQR